MPYDANGNELKVGDKVLIPCTVIAIQPTEDYCNCTVEPKFQMPPYKESDTKLTISNFNTRQLVLEPTAVGTDAATD